MSDLLTKFKEAYEKELRDSVNQNPSMYIFGPDKVPKVVDIMMKAIERGGFSMSSPVLKRVAKSFGITTNTALRARLFPDTVAAVKEQETGSGMFIHALLASSSSGKPVKVAISSSERNDKMMAGLTLMIQYKWPSFTSYKKSKAWWVTPIPGLTLADLRKHFKKLADS
jgi:hypothetical protein